MKNPYLKSTLEEGKAKALPNYALSQALNRIADGNTGVTLPQRDAYIREAARRINLIGK